MSSNDGILERILTFLSVTTDDGRRLNEWRSFHQADCTRLAFRDFIPYNLPSLLL
jgi:hypothetical protein